MSHLVAVPAPQETPTPPPPATTPPAPSPQLIICPPRICETPDPSEVDRSIAQLRERLRLAHMDSVMALVTAVEAKDLYTRRHSLNVSAYAEMLARLLGLRQNEIDVIKIAAVLHDVGKIGVPDSILTKPGALAPVEVRVMREHPAIGAEIIKPVIFLNHERPLVLHHHEWFNGSGYPFGLAGDEIPIGARILHVADSIDAMLSPRVYKSAYSVQRTIDEIQKGSGTQFDPAIAAAAIGLLKQRNQPDASEGNNAGPKNDPEIIIP